MINQFLDDPDTFTVADVGDPYSRLRILRDEEQRRWASARGKELVSASRLVTLESRDILIGFATLRDLSADSKAFRLPIAAIDAIGIRRGAPHEEIERLSELLGRVRRATTGKTELLTTLVDLDRPHVLEALQRAGARAHGANLTWTCPMGEIDPEWLSGSSPFLHDWLTESNEGELIDAVAASYATYRSHYHADSRLADADCAAPYVEAVRQHVRRGGDVALLRGSDGAIVAFSTIDPHDAVNTALGRPAVAEIGVSGVVPGARQVGAYEHSLQQGLQRMRAGQFTNIVFGCTADNFAVQSTWVRIGRFRPRRFCVRLHWWLDH